MRFVVFFADSGQDDYASNPLDKELYDKEDVALILVAGSVHPEVCNSYFSPDIKTYARRFVEQTFATPDNLLNMTSSLVKEWKLGARLVPSDKRCSSVNGITEIVLCGVSRGAITAFEVAKELNNKAPKIPVTVIAVEPVPGNIYSYPGSNAANVSNCSNLTNLKQVSIILGANTGVDCEMSSSYSSRFLYYIHRLFFSQLIPKLPPRTPKEIELIPEALHMQGNWRGYLRWHLAKHWNSEGLLSSRLLSYYKPVDNTHYAPLAQWQKFFGMSRKKLYSYIDPFHPHLKEGQQWDINHETLFDWWKKQDRYASVFSSPLTKALVDDIKVTVETDINSLIKLFKLADQWLILKEDTNSSRYYQVEALRNVIHSYLLDSKLIRDTQLYEVMYDNLLANSYFHQRWNKLQAGNLWTCWNKPVDSPMLKKIFQEHDEGIISLNEMIKALETWQEENDCQNAGVRDFIDDTLRKLHHLQSHLPIEIQNQVNSFNVNENPILENIFTRKLD